MPTVANVNEIAWKHFVNSRSEAHTIQYPQNSKTELGKSLSQMEQFQNRQYTQNKQKGTRTFGIGTFLINLILHNIWSLMFILSPSLIAA